jgi:hypothetical protein
VRSTPRGSSRFQGPHPAQGFHTKTPDHNHDPAPNSHLRCGAHQLLSPHLNGQSRAHSLRGEKKHERSISSQVRDQKIVHNQWTRTIAIGLNTLQRLYNCASEGSLEAVEPFPGLAGVKSTKEENRLPSRSHRSAYRRGAIHYKSHPAPPPNTRWEVCTVKVI